MKNLFKLLKNLSLAAVLMLSCTYTPYVVSADSAPSTERLLFSYTAPDEEISGTVYTYLNKGSTLSQWQYSKSGVYFCSNRTAAVIENILPLEEERYRIYPDKSYCKTEAERIYYAEAVPSFEDKYITFDFAACDLTNFNLMTQSPRIGLSATASDGKTEAVYLKIQDYTDFNTAKKNANTFYPVQIPVSDFIEKGEFKAINGSEKTEEEFDFSKVNGITVTCSLDVNTVEEKLIYAINNMAVSSFESDGNNSEFILDFKDNKLNWEIPDGKNAESFKLFRDGELLSNSVNSPYAVTAAGRYAVCAEYDDGTAQTAGINVGAVSDYRLLNSDASGDDYVTLFDDNFSTPNYIMQSGTWCSASTKTAAFGEKSLRVVMKGSTDAERIYGGLSYITIRNLDYENAALQFWYNPRLKRENTWVGLLSQCVTDNSDPINRGTTSMMKISLKDYLDLTDADYGEGKWIKVTIPVKYFLENGEFDRFCGSDTQFVRHTISGMVFEYSAENIPSNNTDIAYADDIKIINSVCAPENLRAYTDFNSVTLDWHGSGNDAVNYEVFRGKELIGTVSGGCTFTDTAAETGKCYTYCVRAESGGNTSVISSVSVSLGIQYLGLYSSDSAPKTSDVIFTASGTDARLAWNGTADEYIIYKNGSVYGTSTECFFADKAFRSGDSYSVAAVSRIGKTIYAPSDACESSEINGKMNFELYFGDTDGRKCTHDTFGEVIPERLIGEIYNFSGSSMHTSMLIAHYEAENDITPERLISVQAVPLDIPQGKTSVDEAVDYCYGIYGSYRVKAYILKNTVSLSPVTAAVVSHYVETEQETAEEIRVLPESYQTVNAWGISPFSISEQNFLSFINKEDWPEMYDKIYGELGITSIRVPFNAECGNSDGSINTEQLNYRVQYIKRAQEYGINDYIISYWSPPSVWVEKVEGEVTWTKYQYHLIAGHEEDYCNYIVDCLSYLNANGAGLPSGLSFQNEPQDGKNIPAYWLEQYKTVIKLLRQKLDGAGFNSVKIIAPETASYYSQYRFTGGYAPNDNNIDGKSRFNFNEFKIDSDYADSIGVLCVHSYYQTSIGSKNDDIANFAELASEYPEKERWQTEFSGLGGTEECETQLKDGSSFFDTNMGSALFTMRILSSDVGWAGMNRWYYWQAYRSHYNLDSNGGSYDVLNNKAGQQTLAFGQPGGSVKTGKLYEAFKLLFNSVPTGSVVKRVSCTDSEVVNEPKLKSDVIAFETPYGTAVMFINVSNSPKAFDFTGLSGETAGISYITGQSSKVQSIKRKVSDGEVQNVYIPPKSITFVVTAQHTDS